MMQAAFDLGYTRRSSSDVQRVTTRARRDIVPVDLMGVSVE